MQQFFYSGQIRRFVTQFIRMVSNFQVEYGRDRDGNTTLQRVPVIYGNMTRQAAQILKNNSENSLSVVPAMAVYISNLNYARDRVQDPYHVNKMQIRERRYDSDRGIYTINQQDSISIERLMPVPYTLELKLDIWTSNETQKLQLFEQLVTLFNPSLEIQNTDNYVDWSSLSTATLTSTNYSSRTVPAGAEDVIDITTMVFELPIWISSPAKVKKLGVIQKIIASIYTDNGELQEDIFDNDLSAIKNYFTPLNYGVVLLDNTLLLVKQEEIAIEDGKIGTRDSWPALIDVYGKIRPGSSQIRLQIDQEGNEIVGTIGLHPTDNSLLVYNIFQDTLPVNTQAPVNAIVDPLSIDPTNTELLRPAAGTRYLILNDIGSPGDSQFIEHWRGLNNLPLVANSNDIIEYNGVNWWISFPSQEISTVEYVTNLNTAVQYRWDGTQWLRSYQGHYPAGRWTILL